MPSPQSRTCAAQCRAARPRHGGSPRRAHTWSTPRGGASSPSGASPSPEFTCLGVRDPERRVASRCRTRCVARMTCPPSRRDPDVDVVVELIGGTTALRVDPGGHRQGKAVVTANKAVLAAEGRRSRRPPARPGRGPVRGAPWGRHPHPRAAGHRTSPRDTHPRGAGDRQRHHEPHPERDGAGRADLYEDVLAEARHADTRRRSAGRDVEGTTPPTSCASLDATRLRRVARSGSVRGSTAATAGDSPRVSPVSGTVDLAGAARLGLAIKLVARAERDADGSVRAAVTPMAVRATSPSAPRMASQPGGDRRRPGRTCLVPGPGAGGPATASAVLGDLLALARGAGSTWDGLAPASAAPLPIADDLAADHSWLFVAPDAVIRHWAGRARAGHPGADDEAFVVRPCPWVPSAPGWRRLGIDTVLYPVLAEALTTMRMSQVLQRLREEEAEVRSASAPDAALRVVHAHHPGHAAPVAGGGLHPTRPRPSARPCHGLSEPVPQARGANPTGSFKDRGMVVAVARALEKGARAIICASTGNTSASAAAYGAGGGHRGRGRPAGGQDRGRQAAPGTGRGREGAARSRATSTRRCASSGS